MVHGVEKVRVGVHGVQAVLLSEPVIPLETPPLFVRVCQFLVAVGQLQAPVINLEP